MDASFATALKERGTLTDAELSAHLFTDDFCQDPYPFYDYVRDERPVWFCEPLNAWVLVAYDDVVDALKETGYNNDNRKVDFEPVFGRTIFSMTGREHTRKRGAIAPFFTGKGLQRLQGLIEETSAELVRGFADKGQVEIRSEYSRLFTMAVIARILGLEGEEGLDYNRVIHWFDSMLRFNSDLTGDPEIKAVALAASAEFNEFMTPVVESRRREPRDDLISFMVESEFEGVRLSDEEIRAESGLFLSAGWETTDKHILITMLELMRNPDQMEDVRQDRSLIPMAVAEALRHEPVNHFTSRQVGDEDVVVQGQTIPAGSIVLIMLGAANRDPAVFADPGRFDVHRKDLDAAKAFTAGGKHLTFGLGRHFCLGARLARQEAFVAVNDLLEVMHDPHFVDDVPPRWGGLLARGEDCVESFFRSPREMTINFETAGAPV